MELAGSPDFWFLAGEERAMPAIRRFCCQMDRAAAGRVLIESDGQGRPIDVPPGVAAEHLIRGDAPAGARLASRLGAVGADARPEGAVFAFVAAEQSIVRPARELLLGRWGLSADRIVVKGYGSPGDAAWAC